mgnify:FL=1
MKRETLEKIRKIIVTLLVLFISILNTWIAFCTLPVHAEEATIKHSYYVNTQRTYSSKSDIDENKYTYDTDLQFVMFCGSKNGDQTSTYNNVYYLYAYIKNDRFPAGAIYSVNDSIFSGHIDFSYGQYHNGDLISSEWSTYAFVFNNRYNDNGIYETIDTNVPMFDSRDHALSFCRTGDTTGLLNGGSIDNPDFEDTAYAFTGFTANNKMTANWTGTTDRSYLQDQEVEEYVRVNYYFADKEAQDTIKQADAYPDEFATADKTLTIDVSGLKPDDENWFLRYIRITPCYRQAGLGAWGDFYHGDPSYVYFNQDGSIDRIDAPYIKGELSTDMERPVIVLHEAANGNPTESDYSYFEFNNAQSDYFFEMKGRWYTTNDFDLYRDKLVWKYKYSTLLKNNLSTWVSVSDNRSSVGRFQFDVLGKTSWDNLLSSYPVDDRNYIGGSYNLFNKITGYSDALETLKMLLKQPYSLFNGYEVYVRYFRYDENGGIQYSKWTHFYNNLADSDGSSGSRLDDLDNMYSENQSDKGLTDDELSDLENTGNSRNDLDAVPKNNYDYSSLENATMNFFDLLTNFGTMLGQFPSMVAAVFGFLPSWLIGLIAVAIGAVIVCRFIGR